ncbi:UDP-N-acetylmuramate dehydrogenase [Candidatus Saccharibacteria bacterium]|nr:UDP-N-acetylmuramate dehydrogenase [Candidatus Saccharibacteria bacterium]
MDVRTNIPLKNYLTMKLGGPARFMTTATTAEELATACRNAVKQSIPFFILGGGSNVIARDEGFNGIVIRNRILGFDVMSDDASSTTIKIGAGENWDETVKKTVEMGLSGIEAMSAIPGTVGASPIQNIGAYGQEIADTLVSLEAYDSKEDRFILLHNADCGFAYRHSMFRGTQTGRYGITSVTIKLYKASPQPPFYAALQAYLDEHTITLFTPSIIRDAVTAIRTEKLPDPKILPNAGSFFKNAIIDDWQLTDLKQNWPTIPTYELGDKKLKVPTGWLIEQTGLKGTVLHGMKVHDKNALVLINESATSYADLAAARTEIMAKVRDTFRIQIEQEPLEM